MKPPIRIGAAICLAAAAVLLGAVGARAQPAASPDRPSAGTQPFRADLEALTAYPHRLATTEQNHAAADYIDKRLREMGIGSIYTVEASAAQVQPETCRIRIDGNDGPTIPLKPLRPNLIIPPATDADGLSGPYVYAGTGKLAEYREVDPTGAIVGLDYDCADHWHHAFRLGAKAVIFIGDGDSTSVDAKTVPVPANLVRLYADGDKHGEQLRRDHDRVTVTSHTPWRVGTSRNILALIPGTDPKVDADRAGPEIIVLSAHFDSYGQVPHASPGARAAANVAALLQTAAYLQAHRPSRHVLLAFFDNHAQQRHGARAVYRVLQGKASKQEQFAADHRDEKRFVDRALALLSEEDWLGQLVEHRLAQPVSRFEQIADAHPRVASMPSQTEAQRAERRRAMDRAIQRAQAERQRLAEDVEALRRELKLRADHIDADLKTQSLPVYMNQSALDRRALAGELDARGQQRLAELNKRIDQIESKRDRVDRVRELLAEASSPEDYRALPRALRSAAPRVVSRLHERLTDVYRTRRRELEREIAADGAAEQLRKRLALKDQQGGARIALHVHYNFSDIGPRWGVVPGDSTTKHLINTARDAEQPSRYTNVLRAFRTVVDEQGAGEHFAKRTIQQTNAGQRFISGPMVSDGLIAGLYGIFNVSFATGSDSRPRDGHPADTVANLDWRRIASFGREASALVKAIADTPALPTVDQIKPIVLNTYRRWDRSAREAQGNYGLYRVTGGLKEDRAARGAVMAIWPKYNEAFWSMFQDPLPANYLPAWIAPVDAYGLFDLVSYTQPDSADPANVFGAILDARGRVEAASNEETFEQKHPGRYRVEIIPSHDLVVSYPMLGHSDPVKAPFKVMGAVTNTKYPADRQHVGQSEQVGFAYLAERVIRTESARLKVFSERGPVILGLDDLDDPTQTRQLGLGVPLNELTPPPAVHESTAHDLWMLNEKRLRAMRAGGIASAAIEGLHIDAKQLRERANAVDNVHEQASARARAGQLARLAYQPIRNAMNDLIRAVVFLLLLAIPFAFAMERLLIGATTIYGRIGGFVGIFAITFAALYLLHPGFGIAAVPLIILLAFVIMLLAVLVIWILMRKFNTELRAIQGQSSKAHEAQTSRIGTFVAAANMGISTMRRRPLRTALTALTVVLLTFTILCFASVGSAPGVKRIYLGSAGSAEDADLLIRETDYAQIPREVPEVIAGHEGRRGLIAEQWWLSRTEAEAPPVNVARADNGRTQYVQAVWGISPAEMQRWPDMAATLQSDGRPVDPEQVGPRDAFLPPVLRDQLGLEVGDALLIEGTPARFAGVLLTSDLQRLKHIDGEPALPVNFQDKSVLATLEEQKKLSDEQSAEVQRSFARLSPNQIAVVPAELAKKMRAHLRIVRVYLDPDLKAETVGQELARIMPMPVWSRGTSGTERLIFASLIQVEAGQALIIPLVLGGLIVFGTMLGSISDREKEIYTFSALGLAPSHVGLLFFAEAAVYAVVGGMAGQILAQIVAMVTSSMQEAGLITPPEFNFSSTNALFAIFIVMATVMVSALYPAMRASKSANPGLARSWKLPRPKGDDLDLIFPFTVSAYDITGVVSFLAEHFRAHDDAGVGGFAARDVRIERHDDGHLSLFTEVALAPFDLGVTQQFRLTATPSEIPGVDEVAIHCHRLSGTQGDWNRTNKVFIRALRKQFLLWRTLTEDAIESYRTRTLLELGEARASDEQKTGSETGTATEATT
jgi:hypothetical protein